MFLFQLLEFTYILYTQMKKFKLVLNTNHGLLASYVHDKESLFSDNKSWPLAELVRATTWKLLFSSHIPQPFAIATQPKKLVF